MSPVASLAHVDLVAQDRHRHFWRTHAHIVSAFAIAFAICSWFATWGDWKFLQSEALGAFYDAQALSILQGHLDVPREAIGFEAFVVNGKYYGYFGIGPALLRIPLLLLFQNLDGLWSRLMVLLAATIGVGCAWWILNSTRRESAPTPARRVCESLFILAAAVGSTNIFMLARSFVFHEAIIWASTFALLFTVALGKYLRSPSPRLLICACGCAFMSFHSRATSGAGALLALCAITAILIWRSITKNEIGREMFGFAPVRQLRRHALIAVAGIGLTLGTFFAVNYAKFGTFRALPLQYYNLYVQEPARMQNTGARQIHLQNLPTGVATYFGWRGARSDRHFPWIYLARDPIVLGHPAIDVVEEFSSFPISMPALTLLAALGAIILTRGNDERARRLRLPAVCLFLGGGIIFATVGITERYLHDFYPALIVAAAVGTNTISSGKFLPLKVAAFAFLTLISIACNGAFALEHQRTTPWGVPQQKRAEFEQMRQRVDRLFLKSPAAVE